MSHTTQQTTTQASQPVPHYEPPCIETVLTPEALEHEVLYAGSVATKVKPG